MYIRGQLVNDVISDLFCSPEFPEGETKVNTHVGQHFTAPYEMTQRAIFGIAQMTEELQSVSI